MAHPALSLEPWLGELALWFLKAGGLEEGAGAVSCVVWIGCILTCCCWLVEEKGQRETLEDTVNDRD